MPIILEQRFPLGRFNATRWNQNVFEDRHGEWPPSPWRLLRTLAARWFQYSRETGDEDEVTRDELLQQLASQPPTFHVPALTWRGEPSPRQYHKTGVEWTAKGKKDAAYKKAMTTLVPDHFRAIASDQSLYWIWDNVELSQKQLRLLDDLLNRIVYFGRAESFCRIRRVDQTCVIRPNCVPDPFAKDHSPVLVATPKMKLDLSILLASTDDRLLAGRTIPPGTTWLYAKLPQRPAIRPTQTHGWQLSDDKYVMQFAVGGRIFPPLAQWIRVTERFRGIALKQLALLLSNGRISRFADLPAHERPSFSLFSGKSSDGSPLKCHDHPYFAIYPDLHNQPTRLLCFRKTPFTAHEVTALLKAAEEVIHWQLRNREWSLRLVPLPFETPIPAAVDPLSPGFSTWISETPFVAPGNRRRFRKNGRLRPGETPAKLLEKLLAKEGYPQAEIELVSPVEFAEWVAIHVTHKERLARKESRGRSLRMGQRFRLKFAEPVSGPICLGHSSHFGLGLFAPEREE